MATIEQKTDDNLNAFEIKLNTLEQTDVQQNEDIDKLDDHENRINDLEVNDIKQDGEIQSLQLLTTTTTTPEPECPGGKMFKLIDGKCYAYENVKRNFQATQTRCGQIFGNQAGGKIFEPRSDQVIKEVLEYAKIAWAGDSNTNPQLWMGITDEASEGNFVYHSDGQTHKLSWTANNSRNKNCLLIHHSYIPYKYMTNLSCSRTLAAICEWVI